MKCKKCGQTIGSGVRYYRPPSGGSVHRICPSEAERSGVLQGCPPSANCSAGAGADAHPSPIGSVVPRENSGLEAMLTKWRDRRIRKHHEASIKAREGDYAYALQRTAEAEAIEVCIKDLEDELPTDAHQRSGERALARNSD